MASEWFYAKDGKQLGPVSWEQLYQLASTGLIQPADLVWREGMPQWAQASTIPNLFGGAGAAAPAVAASPAPSYQQNYQAVGYATSAGYGGAQPRPVTPMVMGIIGIIYASIGIILGLIGLVSAVSPQTRMMGMQAWSFASATIALALAVLLLVGGIMLVRYQRIGLNLVTSWAIAYIAWDIIVAIVTVTYVMPATLALLQTQMRSVGGWPNPIMPSASFGGGVVGAAIFLMIFPTIALILLNRPGVRGWFKGQ